MTDDELEGLKAMGRRQADQRLRSPDASRRFLLQTGIYTKSGELKPSFGGEKVRKGA